LVAEYTGTFVKGTNDNPDVTFMIVSSDGSFRNSDVRCIGASMFVVISFFAVEKNLRR